VKYGLLLFSTGLACCLALLSLTGASCQRPQPPPPPPAPTLLTNDQVASELEDAGCLASGPGVVDAVAAELQTGHDPWLLCLYEGGTVASCSAPCERAGVVRRPDR
jgi:hypothetical protein